MKLLKKNTIFHIDMDAFYASVEQADQPELKGKSVIIGGSSKRSVVSAASYEARRFGIRSAMPMYEALKRCPEAVVLPVRMARYKKLSGQIMALLKTYSPVVEQVSIDEAFLDVTGYDLLFEDAKKMASAIKKQITDTFDLTCSVGIAPVKFLAKIASDLNKPDGIAIISPDQVDGFIKTLPINKVPGVGKKTYDTLLKMRIKFLGDIKNLPDQVLIRQLGKIGFRLIELSQGNDPSVVKIKRKAKSISSEETFSKDTTDMDIIRRSLLKHAQDVGRALRAKQVKAKNISIKIKHADFKQVSRSVMLDPPSQSTEIIYQAAVKLCETYLSDEPIRLIGVAASVLLPLHHPEQIALFEEETITHENWEKIDHVLDAISEKYGEGVVQKARLSDRNKGKN